jgi:hypothetical protein
MNDAPESADPQDRKEPRDAGAHRILSSRGECQEAFRLVFAEAARIGCRELWLCDVDYADWPLSERAVIDSLSQWAYSHRRLTMLAAGFDEIVRRHARWIDWRRQWSHVVDCRALDERIEASQVPTLLLAPGVVTLRIFDTVHHRGSISHDPADAIRCRELVTDLFQQSSEAFPSTTLGL